MPSSFKAKNLFGSGPHRFSLARQGQLAPFNISLGIFDANSSALGLLELEVHVTGRLIGATEAALWTLRDAVTAELLHPPTPGTLIDLHGRTWTNMSFISWTEEGPPDRGRTRSIAYEAVFRRFASL
jgi:hypothetical protein